MARRPTRSARARRGSAPRRAPGSSASGSALDPRDRRASPGASSSSRRAGTRPAGGCRPRPRAGPPGGRPRRRGRRTRSPARGRRARPACEPKPALSIGIETEPGMWASSNCWSVRTSTSSAPAARCVLDLARRERQQLDPVGEQRAAVERHDRLGSSAAAGRARRAPPSTNSSSSAIASAGLWRRSKPIVEEIFMSIPGPPHIEPPRWPGQTSTSPPQRRAAARAATGRSRARPRTSRSPGPAARRR